MDSVGQSVSKNYGGAAYGLKYEGVSKSFQIESVLK
jgi:hypothetical protein